MRDPIKARKIAEDVIAHCEKRTGDDSLRSIETRIIKAQQDAEKLTAVFIEAKSSLLRANIEKKMSEYETLIKDLSLQKAKIELERGMKITKEDILGFIAELIIGDEDDKDFQRQIIDKIVGLVYVYDHLIVTFLTIGGREIKRIDISLDDVNAALFGLNIGSSLSPSAPPIKIPPDLGVFLLAEGTGKK